MATGAGVSGLTAMGGSAAMQYATNGSVDPIQLGVDGIIGAGAGGIGSSVGIATTKSRVAGKATAAGKGSPSTYSAPKGGGGVSNVIKSNGKTVTFGHGGRHLEGSGLSVSLVEKSIAKNISKMNLRVGDSYYGQVMIDGTKIEYRAYFTGKNKINIGTYYLH